MSPFSAQELRVVAADHSSTIPLTHPEAFGHWLSGFVDGEGHFGLTKQKGRPYCAYFTIGLRADDGAILEQIQTFLECGKIDRERRRHNYRVFNTWDLVSRVTRQFDRFPLRAKKARDFNTWKIAVILIHEIHQRNPVRWSATDSERLAVFKRELKEGRAFVPCAEEQIHS